MFSSTEVPLPFKSASDPWVVIVMALTGTTNINKTKLHEPNGSFTNPPCVAVLYLVDNCTAFPLHAQNPYNKQNILEYFVGKLEEVCYSTYMETFREKVIKFIRKIPKGMVVSYGQVASACGSPRAARQVGFVLRTIEDSVAIPWWRVVNNRGELSIKNNWQVSKDLQRNLLVQEGVPVNENFVLDIKKFRYFYQ